MNASTQGPDRHDQIDVIVASYRRPEMLAKCLDSLVCQQLPAARIIVVHRSDDPETRRCALVERARPIDVVTVDDPGLIAAVMVGVAASTAPIIAFIDDDAEAHVDWLERIATAFADPAVGGVGGRDIIPGRESPLTTDVGRRTWWGRLTGNHHVGIGPPRDVEVLKGVNMAFRADVLAVPCAGVLRGPGAEPDWEVLACDGVSRSGHRLVYDPAILVDHHCGPRILGPGRDRVSSTDVYLAAFNATVSSTVLAPHLVPIRLAYALGIGARDQPGLVRAAAAVVRREPDIVRKLVPSVAGNLRAGVSVLARRMRRSSRPATVTALQLRSAANGTLRETGQRQAGQP